MAAYGDLEVGDRIYRIPETVISIDVETETNRHGSGKHRTGRVIIVTQMTPGITSQEIVPSGSLVHTDDQPGCHG